MDNPATAAPNSEHGASERDLEPVASSRKGEATAGGCREMASDDRARASAVTSDRMRLQLEQSAQVWASRANMLDRLEAKAADRRSRSAADAAATADEGKGPANG